MGAVRCDITSVARQLREPHRAASRLPEDCATRSRLPRRYFQITERRLCRTNLDQCWHLWGANWSTITFPAHHMECQGLPWRVRVLLHVALYRLSLRFPRVAPHNNVTDRQAGSR